MVKGIFNNYAQIYKQNPFLKMYSDFFFFFGFELFLLRISLITQAGQGSACNSRDTGDVDSIPGSRRSPGEGNGDPLEWVLPGKSHGRSLAGYSPRGHKESDPTEHARMHTSLDIWLLLLWHVMLFWELEGSALFGWHTEDVMPMPLVGEE